MRHSARRRKTDHQPCLSYNLDLMSINPEKNKKIRALLYVIGCGGLAHLLTLLVLAISRRDAAYFHPLYTIDADQLWPSSHGNWVVYVAGWLVFTGLIYTAYRLIQRGD
jgi:hypothetical protein